MLSHVHVVATVFSGRGMEMQAYSLNIYVCSPAPHPNVLTLQPPQEHCLCPCSLSYDYYWCSFYCLEPEQLLSSTGAWPRCLCSQAAAETQQGLVKISPIIVLRVNVWQETSSSV